MKTTPSFLTVLTGLLFVLGCSVEEPALPTSAPVPQESGAPKESGELEEPDESTPVDLTCRRTLMARPGSGLTPVEVRVAADFEPVPWSGGIWLRDEDGDGVWHGDVDLAPGRYTYRLIVDEVWTYDLENPDREENEFGSLNSVFVHQCPFEPECLTPGECESGVCSFYRCEGGDEPPPPQESGPEPEEPEVDVNPTGDEENEESEEDEEDGPECEDHGDCRAGLVCSHGSCVAPECLFDGDCSDPVGTRCLEGLCEPNPCEVTVFILRDSVQSFNTLHVAGSFNQWPTTLEEGGLAMSYNQEAGLWFAKLPLGDGSYTYKFVGNNGQDWFSDPENPLTAPDGFGSVNSVLNVACQNPECTGGFDWRDSVMYFAMVDRFYDSDSSANEVSGATGGDATRGPSGQVEGGDLNGVTAKLPYLTELGVNTIWLSAPFENRDESGAAINPGVDSNLYSGYHGYWPSPADIDYSDPHNPTPAPRVESRIGTKQELKTLVDQAHRRITPGGSGVKVLFDYVMNHVDINSGLYAAHPEWFVTDGGEFPLCGPRNLWEDPYWGTRCAFTDYLPAFDFYNPEARAWSIADALWWAREFGIDGYRLDAIKHVPFSWLTELRAELSEAIEDPTGDRFYLVGETFSYDNRELLRDYVDPETMLDGQFDFPFKARLCEALFSFQLPLGDFASWLDGNDAFYGEDAVMTTWIGNHDVPRAIHFASGQIENCREGSHPGNSWTASYPQPVEVAAYERLALAFVVMMTGKGVPLIYYGDEIGLAGGGDPDNRRRMIWDDGMLMAPQLRLRDTVGRLGTIRQSNRVLSRGRRTTLSAGADTWVYSMGGCDAGGEIVVAINRGEVERTVGVPSGQYKNLMDDTTHSGGEVTLAPRGFLLLENTAAVGLGE